MSSLKNISPSATCLTEYDTLQRVFLCEPKFMKIPEAINETQEHFIDDGIEISQARKEHKGFIQTLEDNGVEVIKLPPEEQYPEQVFTRDIGFTIGNTIFISNMARDVRQGEEQILVQYLENHQIPYRTLDEHYIEGGDVITDGRTVYVGVSYRTKESAINHLQSLLPEYDVIPVPFNEKYLHLDCAFNVISPDEALIFPEAFQEEELELLKSRYNVIEVPPEEQFTLGTNMLSIGENKIISLPVNEATNNQLRNRGYTVIEVPFSEIIKSGGSFRCCSLPLLRG